MLIVETIAKIRRAFFGQGRSIKAICRELRVSRKVVRKVIRSKATEFRYEREAQPLPKVGPWRDKLDQLLLANEGKASRERLTLIRLFEELRGCGYDGGYDAVRRTPESGVRSAASHSRGLRPAELRAGRGLPIRLEPRGRPAGRRDGDREGRPCSALSQPDAVRARLSARDAGDGVRRARPSLRPVQGRLRARHLRQHEDGGGDGLRRQATPLQSPLSADVQPLPH